MCVFCSYFNKFELNFPAVVGFGEPIRAEIVLLTFINWYCKSTKILYQEADGTKFNNV